MTVEVQIIGLIFSPSFSFFLFHPPAWLGVGQSTFLDWMSSGLIIIVIIVLVLILKMAVIVI